MEPTVFKNARLYAEFAVVNKLSYHSYTMLWIYLWRMCCYHDQYTTNWDEA